MAIIDDLVSRAEAIRRRGQKRPPKVWVEELEMRELSRKRGATLLRVCQQVSGSWLIEVQYRGFIFQHAGPEDWFPEDFKQLRETI